MLNPSGINLMLEDNHQYHLRVKEHESEAEQHSTEYLRGYLARHDDVGSIRKGIRAVGRVLCWAGSPRIEAYRNVLESKLATEE